MNGAVLRKCRHQQTAGIIKANSVGSYSAYIRLIRINKSLRQIGCDRSDLEEQSEEEYRTI